MKRRVPHSESTFPLSMYMHAYEILSLQVSVTASVAKQPKFIRINNDLKLIKFYALHLYGIKVGGGGGSPRHCLLVWACTYVCVC